jgi:hypothetical protein
MYRWHSAIERATNTVSAYWLTVPSIDSMLAMDAAQRLVIPVGQYGGAVRRTAEGETGAEHLVAHTIRRGDMLVTVTQQAAMIWMAAHGRLAEVGTTTWTLPAVLERGAGDLAPQQQGVLYGYLLGFKLVAEVDPDGPEAMDFARTHRLMPSAFGQGNTSEDPFRFRVGHPPKRTAMLGWNEMRLWRDGHQEPSLWDACLARAAAEEQAGYPLEPERMLADTLRTLHIMLALRLTYIDVAHGSPGR